ncbi:MAG TPA: M13 family metallopeptidase N-terminal domain-containing protein, partial [Candidatus Saccharimonadales bacterium]|nr:M13 family metallopeptidase N-terminal domain-containing protein [Candidatus Saccharimonadales bacterium]
MKKLSSTCVFLILALASSMVFAQSTKAKPQPAADSTLPYTPSLDVTAMDKSVAPCVDFYQYSCGGWQKKNPIPPDQSSWSVYGKLYQDNLGFLRTILEQAASAKGERDSATRLIGDFYSACMDEKAVERRGLSVLKPELEAIARVKTAHGLAPLIVHMQLAIPGASIAFSGGSSQDPDDSEQQIASFDQGGLGLPDRDYYTKDDAKSKEIRERYVKHVQKMFELLGETAAAAGRDSDTVMRMETALAKSSLTRVERRDPYKLKNKMKIADLEKLAPNFDWQTYLREAAAPKFEVLNVTAPSFFKEMDRQLAEEPLENWKTYLRYHLANGYAAYLSSPFVLESFEFYSKYLRGAKEMRPRWKRCVQAVDNDLGDALGQAYVRKAFSPELKASTLDMVR